MEPQDKCFLWLVALIILATFLFAGEPDVQDAIIGLIVPAGGGR